MKRSAFWCGFMVIVFVFTQVIFTAQAINHRRDLGQTGRTNEIIRPPIQTVWIELVGATRSYPAVVEDKLYIGTTWGLVCFNARWGTKIWEYISKDFRHSSPAIYEGNVYAGAMNYMYCVSARTGSLRWKFETPEDTPNSSPIVYNNRVYFASGNRLYALNAHTGKEVWSIGFPNPIDRPIAISGGRFFVAAQDRLYGFNLATHTKIWEFHLPNIVKYGYAATERFVYVSVDQELFKIDARTGRLTWKQFFGGNALNPVSVCGNDIFASFDQYFYCIDKETGRVKWQFEAGFYIESSPVVSNQYVWIGSDDFNIYCLDRHTGKRLFFSVSGSTSYYVTTGNQYLYSLSVFGELFCFAPAEARERRKITIELWIGRSYARINGNFSGIDTTPFIQEGSTMLPIRTLGEFLGAYLRWEPEEKKVVYSIGTRFIELWIGKNQANVNARPVELSVPPLIVEGRTYVPLRFVAENLGAQVSWDPQEKRVTLVHST